MLRALHAPRARLLNVVEDLAFYIKGLQWIQLCHAVLKKLVEGLLHGAVDTYSKLAELPSFDFFYMLPISIL